MWQIIMCVWIIMAIQGFYSKLPEAASASASEARGSKRQCHRWAEEGDRSTLREIAHAQEALCVG